MRKHLRRTALTGSAVAMTAAVAILSGSAANAVTCSNGKLWIGLSGPPRVGDVMTANNAEANSTMNWNALTTAASGAQDLPIHIYLRYLTPAEEQRMAGCAQNVAPGAYDSTMTPYVALERSFEAEAVYYASLGYKVLVTVRTSQQNQAENPSFTGGNLDYPPASDYSNGYPQPCDFANFIKGVVDRIGSSIEGIEVTNEGNVTAGYPSSAASDGAGQPYDTPAGSTPTETQQAEDMAHEIIAGVEAAHNELHSRGNTTTKVGLNWAYDYGNFTGVGSTGNDFFHYLNVYADSSFVPDVDFFGEHTYPNFGSGATGTYGMTSGEITALNAGRSHMTDIHLPSSVPIRVTEIGYPSTTTSTSYIHVDPGTGQPVDSESTTQVNEQTDKAYYWQLVIAAAQSVMTTDNVTTMYAFLYQENPSNSVSGDYGIVYPTPTPTLANQGAMKPYGSSDNEGNQEVPFTTIDQSIQMDNPHSCAYSG